MPNRFIWPIPYSLPASQLNTEKELMQVLDEGQAGAFSGRMPCMTRALSGILHCRDSRFPRSGKKKVLAVARCGPKRASVGIHPIARGGENR
jgi:hypothetical protein